MTANEAAMSVIESTVNPLVTVYVTNFNYANYIEQSIESVLAQTYKILNLSLLMMGQLIIQEKLLNATLRRKIFESYFRRTKV